MFGIRKSKEKIKWRENSRNSVLDSDGFYTSYNPSTGNDHVPFTELSNLLTEEKRKDGEETALCTKEGEWLIHSIAPVEETMTGVKRAGESTHSHLVSQETDDWEKEFDKKFPHEMVEYSEGSYLPDMHGRLRNNIKSFIRIYGEKKYQEGKADMKEQIVKLLESKKFSAKERGLARAPSWVNMEKHNDVVDQCISVICNVE